MYQSPSSRLPRYGVVVAVALVAAAMLLPRVVGWEVHISPVPPLLAHWAPRVGPGTLPALLLAFLAVRYAADFARTASWRGLLIASYAAGLAWLVALALVDGLPGMGKVLDSRYEYMDTARAIPDFSAVLPGWVSRITLDAAPHNWTAHVAGHPPGATLFFWTLVRLGFDTGVAAGFAVVVVAATTPLAVLALLRRLGAEGHARRAAPFLVFAPGAIWAAVSADAVFAAVTAWGTATLAFAATSTGWPRRVAWSVLSGLLLGATVMMSYGLPLIGILALTVLALARTRGGSWWPLPIAAAAALAVVLGFAAYGFNYLAALPALHTRYYQGVAHVRPAWYWVWGDLAVLVLAAGPLMAAGVATVVGRPGTLLRDPATRVVAGLTLAGVAMVAVADLSQFSRAEVERIWLPFMPWLLVSCALLPARWRCAGLGVQVVLALLIQHLLMTHW